MKIVITGHTQGIGKFLFDHYSKLGHEVTGISRSNGYDLTTDIQKAVEVAAGADLFINSACVDRCQLELADLLHDKVKQMIVFGSIAGDYDMIIKSSYSANKKELEKRCKDLSLLTGNQILHLKISMLEDAVSGDVLIKYQEVADAIDFWINNPRITALDFEFKLTPFTLEKIKEKFGASQQAIDYVLQNMCQEKQDHFQ